MNSKFELMIEGYQSLNSKIDDLSRKTDERFDLVDFKFSVLNQKIDGVAADLKATDKRLSDKIDAVERNLSAHIVAVSADLKAHRADTEAHHGVYLVKEKTGTFKKLSLCMAMLLLTLPALAAGTPVYPISPQIPLDSWIYPAIERVMALSYLQSSLVGMRPLTRLEAARLLREASLQANLDDLPTVAGQLLQRLQTEFREELEEGSGGVSARLLRNVELIASYRDGDDSMMSGTDGRQFALDYNNFGRSRADGGNLEFNAQIEARLFDRLLLTWRPELAQREDDGSSFATLAAMAAVSCKGVEFSVGRQSLWWGQGRHGSLLLTNNAQPLDMLRLTNPSPLQLPWLLKHLGPFRFDLFVSRLDEDRIVSKPYFGGMRFNIKPSRYFELGASRTVMFGGDGRPQVDAGDFLTIVGGENLSGAEDTSNSIAGVDALINVPHLWGMQIYGELYGEDEAGGLPAKNSWLAGVYLPQIEPSGRLSLRVEYADTTQLFGGNPVLYRHGIYQSGYIYDDQILGHHTGSDATDLFMQLRVDYSERLSLRIGLDYEERGKALALREKHRQADLSATWRLDPKLSLTTRYAYDHIKNSNFVEGDEDSHLLSVGFGQRF